ncbi:hypothetical protein HND97_17250 [Vibrio cholerae]|nr:hypothetical protein HND97_17250 [Vibrio cholerae]
MYRVSLNTTQKSANVTTTHIRFRQQPITAPYPVRHAWLVSLSNLKLLHERDIARKLNANGYLLLNTALTGKHCWQLYRPRSKVACRPYRLHHRCRWIG